VAETKAHQLWTGLIQRRGVRQFVKFGLVGATSTVIDFGLLWLLLNPLDLRGRLLASLAGWPAVQQLAATYHLHRIVANSISFLVAVTNGFIWNSRWTFRGYGRGTRRLQYLRFLLVNLVGLMLNNLILSVVAHAIPASLLAHLRGLGRDPAAMVGKAVATAVVVFWNFGANKYWTFAGHSPPRCS